MNHDVNKIDETVLALLYLTMLRDASGIRALKTHDWGVLDRLHQGGYIGDPRTKAKSVVLTEAGAARAKELFLWFFTEAG
jgi:hypothetical protein